MLATALFLASLVCTYLWIAVIAPLLMRAVGVPVGIGLWRIDRRNQHLSRRQYVWAVGIVAWGMGMFLGMNVSDYLEWRFGGDAFAPHTLIRIAISFLIWALAGWQFGVLSFRHRASADVSGK